MPSRRDLHRSGQHDDLRGDVFFLQPALEQARIAGCDAKPSEIGRRIAIAVLRHRDREAAPAETERAQFAVGIGLSVRSTIQRLFPQYVAADHTEVADAFRDQAGDIVVPHQQQVDRQRFAVTEQAITTFAEAQSSTRKQVARRIGQAA